MFNSCFNVMHRFSIQRHLVNRSGLRLRQVYGILPSWRGMNHCLAILGCLATLLAASPARGERPPSPFGVTASLEARTSNSVVQFNFKVPPEHILYAARLHFETEDGTELIPTTIDKPVTLSEVVPGHEKQGYDKAFKAQLVLPQPLPDTLVVRFQGCSNSACYFPEKHFFNVTSNGISAVVATPPADSSSSGKPGALTQVWQADAETFKVVGRGTGYLPANDFLSFLTDAKSGKGLSDGPLGRFEHTGLALTLLLILLGGLGLNLTPCVLPLIPINLAIIGAGRGASSKGRGFALGGVYGLGMALTYGGLGLVVVLTGSKFGALNSSVWFNVIIALIFVVMSLAMFDLVNVDFSRFQSGKPGKKGQPKSQFVVAFSVGVVAALLAGACVAPVVISVLLLSTRLYAQGILAGLALPFFLGLGMSLPWPFAGAGLTCLPKPGRWMKNIKHGFGAVILLFAAYYAHLGWNLAQARRQMVGVAATLSETGGQAANANAALAEALRQARQDGRPVFIDFAASWCKNCLAMDETVFNTAEVKQRLKDFVVVRYLAEQPNQTPAKQTLDYFGVIGLPTYVVLLPEKAKAN